MNAEDGTETAQMETLEEPKLAAVGNPRLGAVQESSEYGSPVYTDFGAIFQVLVSPHTFVQPTECTVCFSQSVVDLLVNLGV